MKKIFLHLLVFFLAAQAIALFVGTRFIAQQLSLLEDPEDPGNALTLLLYVVAAAAVLLLVLKFYSGTLFFQALEFALVFFSAFMALQLFLDALPSLAAALLAGASNFFYPPARKYLLLLSSAVAGALLGASLGAVPAIAFAVLLSAYDVLAVFYTKHMIALAQGLASRGAAMSIKISAAPSTSLKKTSKATKNPRGKNNAATRGTDSIELGTGDIVIPAMIVVSAAKLSAGHALAALAGSLAGLALLLWLMTRRKGYWPALPPIVLGSLALLAAATFF